MTISAWYSATAAALLMGSVSPGASARTVVSIDRGHWTINGKVTYPRAPAEGLLMNVRMVNAVFEDRGRVGYEAEAEANTNVFVARIPDYVRSGVRAFTVCLQGGMPGYEGARNSAFEPDGELRASYMHRAQRVIDACDRQGAVVILGCFYQRQDQWLRDEQAVRTGVANVCRWIRRGRWHNVVLEVANEYGHSGYNHPVLRTPEGQVELIRLAHETAPGLLVSTSGMGDGPGAAAVVEEADFVLMHLNGVPVSAIAERVAALRRYGKPIVCNEDQKEGEEGAEAAARCVAAGASWGFMLEGVNQRYPFRFGGAKDDPAVYSALRRLTSPAVAAESLGNGMLKRAAICALIYTVPSLCTESVILLVSIAC